MCDQTTTNICDNLAAQANELRIVEQRESTIAAALALPEAERYRLRQLLDEQSERRIYNRYRYMILIEEKVVARVFVPSDEQAWHDKEVEKLVGVKWSFDEWIVEIKRFLVSPQAIEMSPFLASWYEKDVPPEVAASRLNFYMEIETADFAPVYPESDWPADVTTTGTYHGMITVSVDANYVPWLKTAVSLLLHQESLDSYDADMLMQLYKRGLSPSDAATMADLAYATGKHIE